MIWEVWENEQDKSWRSKIYCSENRGTNAFDKEELLSVGLYLIKEYPVPTAIAILILIILSLVTLRKSKPVILPIVLTLCKIIALTFCKLLNIPLDDWNKLEIPGDSSNSPPPPSSPNTGTSKSSKIRSIFDLPKKRKDK